MNLDDNKSQVRLAGLLWENRLLIISITVLAIITSSLYLYLAVKPQYSASSLVAMNVEPEFINTASEQIKSIELLKKSISDLQLDPQKYNENFLESNVNVEFIKETKLIRISVKSDDPKMASDLANMIAYEAGMQLEIFSRSSEIVLLREKLVIASTEAEKAKGMVDEANHQLSTTSEKISTNKSLSDAPYLHSIVAEQQRGSGQAGALQFTSEEINPVYVEVKKKLAEASLDLSKFTSEKNNLTNLITENEKVIQQMQNGELNKDKISLQTFNDSKSVFITPAVESGIPVNSNKAIYVGMIAALSLLCSGLYLIVKGALNNEIAFK